jgi:hypothetical protein
MLRNLRWAGPFLTLALLGTAVAADKKDSEKPPTKEKVEKMVASGKFVGKLTQVENSGKDFTVQVEYLEPDPAKLQALDQFIAQKTLEIRAASIRDRAARAQQFQAELARRQLDVYKKAHKDIKLEAADNIKVRVKYLPVEYDEKGKVKKYTPKELADLKGPDKKLPGYTADLDNLGKGQLVEVYIPKPKKDTTRAKERDKDKDLPPERLKAVMIVILAEPKEEK